MPYWRLYYHITWSTAGRLRCLTGDRAEVVEACLRKKTHELGGLVHAVAIEPEHVHLAVSLPPSKGIGVMVGQLKGLSSLVVGDRYPDIKAEGFCWQEEYGVVSFNEGTLPRVIDYVRNQPSHHRDARLLDVFESTVTGPPGKPSLGQRPKTPTH